ncbi:MAG TPA: tetratricopeptide repeat protein, partial [Spirochaetes bacterium]|nr:tetratricopeptide repeat protein [Spirochaetota bacterium]
KKEYDKSLLTFKQCLKIREAIGDRLGYASTAYNIALVQVENNKKSEALKYINEAVDIERAYGSPKYKSSVRLLNKIDKMDLSADTIDAPEGGMESPSPDN